MPAIVVPVRGDLMPGALRWDSATEERAEALFQLQLDRICRRTDRLFAGLLCLQFVGGIVLALMVSPLSWEGSSSYIHPHVFAALILGATITSLPVYLALRRPGRTSTRFVIAIAQGLSSGLLIHLSGGRIETHFHVFGSLAFLAFYRDWRVLIVASAVIGADHMIRGILWPQSVYGVLSATGWRTVEHVAWVVFEDLFLILSCHWGLQEMREVARRTAQVESSWSLTETTVSERTAELRAANDALESTVSDLRAAQEELRHAKDEAEAANSAKSRFLANMSHEIRTPMNGVIGMASLLADSDLSDEDRDQVQTIVASANALMTVINDILDFSKIEAGKLDLVDQDFNIAEMIEEVMELFGVPAKNKGLRLELELGEEFPLTVNSDPVRLRQILSNYVNNAVKFSEGGTIRIRAAVDRGEAGRDLLRVAVSDEGVGISEGQMHQLFQTFSQVDGSTTRKYGGTGLGLAIVKQLAELLGGAVGVESEPGQGSTFWFTATVGRATQYSTPQSETPAHVTVPESAPLRVAGESVVEAAMAAKPRRVLLVEDNPVNRKVAEKMLNRLGYEHHSAENGEEGLAALQAGSFDLVLSDIQMPVMDGFEFARRIRGSESPHDQVPIIAMTANAMKGDREICIESGMNDYLSKPVKLDDLEAKLQRWIPPIKRRPAA